MEQEREEQGVVAPGGASAVRDLRTLLGPTGLDPAYLHPDALYDEYSESCWAKAETAEQALAVWEREWGADCLVDLLGPEWRQMASELVEQWLRPEPVPEDHWYCQEARADGDPCPLWWRQAPEGAPGAARYWKFEP
jgi:hypothetical protein